MEHSWIESQWKAPMSELDVGVEQDEFYTLGEKYRDDIALRALSLTYGGTIGVDEVKPDAELSASQGSSGWNESGGARIWRQWWIEEFINSSGTRSWGGT